MSDRGPSRPGDTDPDETHLVDTPPGPLPNGPGERQWSDLRLLEEIGHGGFGRVYRAWDEALAREVALKIIKPQDETHRADVLREGQMLARVKHPNVVTVFRAQQVGQEVGITMELINGRDLSDVVSHAGPMSADEASVVGIKVGQALAAVHGAGLLHRDVKARNVMRESGGRIVLMDFGAGRELVPNKPSNRPAEDLSGTPLYLAPELFTGRPASPASDLYSLGVLLFYLVTRKYPVESPSLSELLLKHSAGERRLLSDIRPDLPPAFVQVVHRALSPKPEHRQASAGALIAELSQAMPGAARRVDAIDGPSPEPQPVVDPRARTGPSIARWTLAAGMVVVSLVVLGVLTTAHYDRALGRAGFSDAGPITWLEYGSRSVFPLIVMTTGLVLLWRLAAAVWYFTKRAVPPVQRAADLARTSITGRLLRLAPDGSAIALGLLVVQVLLLAGWAWAFWPMLVNLPTMVNTADSWQIALLNPDRGNGQLYGYRSLMTPWLALMSVGWYWLLVRSPAKATVPRTTAVAGVTLLIMVVLLLETPYRLFYKSEGFQVTHAGQRCYEIGARGAESLLYCPDLPKLQRLPIVKSIDLQGKLGAEKIFVPPGPGPGK